MWCLVPGCLDPVGFFFFLYFLPLFSARHPSFALSHNSLELRLLGDKLRDIFVLFLPSGGAWRSWASLGQHHTKYFYISACHERHHFEQPRAHLQWIVWFISLFFHIHTPSRGSINAERIKDVGSWLLKGYIHWEINISGVGCGSEIVFVEAATSRVVYCEEHPKNSQSFNL